jgi:hypothetical protein
MGIVPMPVLDRRQPTPPRSIVSPGQTNDRSARREKDLSEWERFPSDKEPFLNDTEHKSSDTETGPNDMESIPGHRENDPKGLDLLPNRVYYRLNEEFSILVLQQNPIKHWPKRRILWQKSILRAFGKNVT